MTSAAISRARKAAAVERGPNPYKADPPDPVKCANCGRHLTMPTGRSVAGGVCDRCFARVQDAAQARKKLIADALARRAK